MRRQHDDDDVDNFDERGLLRDGGRLRIPMFLRDGRVNPRLSETQRAVATDSVRITDGTDNPFALNRPGFRVRVGDTRQAVRDALADYENDLVNRWRGPGAVCPQCDGSGEAVNGDGCRLCHGEGAININYESSPEEALSNTETHHEGLPGRRADHRSLDQIMKDHQQRMAKIYNAYSHEISQEWRKR